MPELVIRYKDKKTLEALMDIAKYFGFSVIGKKKRKDTEINGVTIIPVDSLVDISGLETIFSNKNMDAKQLRKDAWQRNP